MIQPPNSFKVIDFGSKSSFGKVLAGKSLAAGLALAEIYNAEDSELPAHVHENAYFCFILEGSYRETCNRTSKLCEPRSLIFHPPDEKHADYFFTNTRCFNVQISDQWLTRTGLKSNVANSAIHIQNEAHIKFSAQKLYREFRTPDDLSPFVIEGLTIELIAEAFRASSRKRKSPPPWLERARKTLDYRFAEQLPLACLSAEAAVHPVHLAREFRRFYGCTTGEYARQKRIEFACRQLISTDFPICDIAHAAGFFDQSHFVRTFKKFTGMTPSEYRFAFCSG
jgi:AraC-like DNA-binding protein